LCDKLLRRRLSHIRIALQARIYPHTASELRAGQAVPTVNEGDILVVTKLDRFGRNTTNVLGTVGRLASMGVHVHYLALKDVDLTPASGKLHMMVSAAVAQFERDLLIERTHAGLARARAGGRKLGRKDALTESQKTEIRER
jgi:putative DNA-invertase from lambdoid prophage Rac